MRISPSVNENLCYMLIETLLIYKSSITTKENCAEDKCTLEIAQEEYWLTGSFWYPFIRSDFISQQLENEPCCEWQLLLKWVELSCDQGGCLLADYDSLQGQRLSCFHRFSFVINCTLGFRDHNVPVELGFALNRLLLFLGLNKYPVGSPFPFAFCVIQGIVYELSPFLKTYVQIIC